MEIIIIKSLEGWIQNDKLLVDSPDKAKKFEDYPSALKFIKKNSIKNWKLFPVDNVILDK